MTYNVLGGTLNLAQLNSIFCALNLMCSFGDKNGIWPVENLCYLIPKENSYYKRSKNFDKRPHRHQKILRHSQNRGESIDDRWTYTVAVAQTDGC